MDYIKYTSDSVYVFIVSFIFGTVVNRIFSKFQRMFVNPSALVFGIAQLITIVTIAYLFHKHNQIEPYTPHVLFSSFLMSLQTNMIDNFRTIILI
jgi:uncharacterized membrane protein YoaK (UPF0700 family)